MMEAIFLALFGLIIGSFVTMLSYRMVHGGGYFGRSKCVMCSHTLGIFDLVPLFSYLFQKGKCRYCKKKVSPRYIMTETLSAISFAMLYNYLDDRFLLLVLSLMVTGLLTMIVIDFEHMVIPDEIQLFLAAVGLVYAFYTETPLAGVAINVVICLAIALALKFGFIFFAKKDGLGWGDVKFFAVAAIYIGIESLAAFFLISGVAGIAIAIVWKILKKGERFPFGPALAFSLYLCVLFPKVNGIAGFLNS